jgi:cytochrome c oxidase accessory protein FixG
MNPENAQNTLQYQENFRNHLGNVTPDGHRLKIYPTQPKGRHHSARRVVSWVLLAVLFAGPFIKINGHPLLLLNILKRQFVLFGVPFWPQDFYLFLLTMLSLLVAIVLFTSVFGRLWCGWACPQTVFLEMVFRKIEYWLEGNGTRQRRFDQAPWTTQKLVRKTLKHAIFVGISFLIANTFLAYIVGIDELQKLIKNTPLEHPAGFAAIAIFTLLFYGVFAFFREQACIVVCPYGRWQSVMVNPHTIAVTYDYKRGEPRTKSALSKKMPATPDPQGDCVDCGQCIRVCPTGIDIRNGIQLECVNCTACIDACDAIMEKVARPKGLIRYSSFSAVEHPQNKKWLNPRILGYAAVLMLLLTSLVYLFSTRAPMQAIILREPGQLYNKLPDGNITNFYSVKIINKTFEQRPLEIRLAYPAQGQITLLGALDTLPPQGMLESRFYLALPATALKPGRNEVRFALYSAGEQLATVSSSFLGPFTTAR